MKLILDTLERARLAASPADAILLADAIADLHALEEALDRYSWPLDDAARALDDLAAIRTHVRTRPLDGVEDGLCAEERQEAWLGELERLAQ